MDAKKCDRCGMYYDAYDGAAIFKDAHKSNQMWLMNQTKSSGAVNRGKYDLCQECSGSLWRFLQLATAAEKPLSFFAAYFRR